MNIYYGVVENRNDPLQLGRCQVRVVGLHTHDKSFLPTEDLPWALPVQPITSAAMNGIGQTPIGPVEGTSVIIMFADDAMQQPIILGSLAGISSAPESIEADDIGGIQQTVKIDDIRLYTIDGPTNGNVLTFEDTDTGRTNLTSPLTANMGVVGYGIPDGTKIVSIDNGTQITISNPVSGYVKNIITFTAVPTNIAAVNASKIADALAEKTKPTATAPATGTQSAPATPAPTATNKEIPTIPPPKSSSNPSKSAAGIKALIAACDKLGLTTKEQKCALLAIAGGESRWIPQKEGHNYRYPNIKRVFSFLTDEEAQRISGAAGKGITKEQFFSVVYGPTKRGKNFLGNKTDADGGKYYGRGFIQLTGRGNYQRYQTLANKMGLSLDIVNNPDSLDDDINVSALVAALYIVDRVVNRKRAKANAHPGFFIAARKAVGVNAGNGYAHKQEFYDYFYGHGPSNVSEKDAAPPVAEPPTEFTGVPGPSLAAENVASSTYGFRDPNNKYPLPEYLNEVDTNRLARGIIKGTIVETKDTNRVRSVPKAIVGGVWSQPEAPFAAKYPYNKVLESESGHIQEWDDTPGNERIHTYHRSGTFSEIDANGTQVNYIVGDNYILMERNGNIHVAGECNITAEGNINIFSRTDANIEVANNATIKVGNNLDLGVHNDVDMAVGGNFKLNVAGDYSVQAANINNKAGNISTQATGTLQAKASTMNQESTGSMDILAGGTLNVDYSQGHFGEGASGANDVETFTLDAPPAGDPQFKVFEDIPPLERSFEELTRHETPEEFNTPEGRRSSYEIKKDPEVLPPSAAVVEESSPVTSGGTDVKIPVDCKIIYTTKNFTNSYTLSKNFTLGMLIDGGLGKPHILVDQMLNENGKVRLYTTQEIVCNLAQLAQNVLEPLLEILPQGINGYRKQWKINSGYRYQVGTGEDKKSQHCKGQAVDLGLIYKTRAEKIDGTYDFVQRMEKIIPYDQLILEYRAPQSCWIHCSYIPTGRRKMAFTMLNDSSYPRRGARGFHKITSY